MGGIEAAVGRAGGYDLRKLVRVRIASRRVYKAAGYAVCAVLHALFNKGAHCVKLLRRGLCRAVSHNGQPHRAVAHHAGYVGAVREGFKPGEEIPHAAPGVVPFAVGIAL